MRILIIDDETEILTLFKYFMKTLLTLKQR